MGHLPGLHRREKGIERDKRGVYGALPPGQTDQVGKYVEVCTFVQKLLFGNIIYWDSSICDTGNPLYDHAFDKA